MKLSEDELRVIELIQRDESYRNYFFNKVSDVKWFNVLKSEGFFEAKNNPASIQDKGGSITPYWEPILYLERISLQIKGGQAIEFIDEILEIIKEVSKSPYTNYRTWYLFIKILANLPNENISKEILHFIPVWLKEPFDTTLQSSELCEKLLPKFLNESPTLEDIEKADIILRYLFKIERTDAITPTWSGESKYRSRVSLHYLSNALIKKKLVTKIALHLSKDIILYLANTLKELLLDFPTGINTTIKDGEKQFPIKIIIEGESLRVILNKEEDTSDNFDGQVISNYESYNEDSFKAELIETINSFEIGHFSLEDNSYNISIIVNALFNGSYDYFTLNSIRKLGGKHYDEDKLIEVLSLILRDMLNEKVKLHKPEGLDILKVFCFDKKYRLPFYRRLAFFVMNENWEKTKALFWELIGQTDIEHYFSQHDFNLELYDLLNKNQHLFTDEEKNQLNTIIEIGPQDLKSNGEEKDKDYWQLGWYSALRDISPFKDNYTRLSTLLNLTHEHYESKGEITLRSGTIPPLSIDEVLRMSNKEIVEYIHSFKPKDHWEKPNISGLSESIQKAVEAQPQKFSEEIELYKNVYYIYAYRILTGFEKAWKEKKTFNWSKVLNFCEEYISDNRFYSGLLNVKHDGWGADADWVVGAIAELLTMGMQNDEHAFEFELLPQAKRILQLLTNNLVPIDDFTVRNMDYATYSLNSTSGKVLRALFIYSLRRARKYFKFEDSNKWEPEVKSLFEGAITKGIIDCYILEGMYFEQFYFLDKDWILAQIKKHYDLPDKEWLAFLGGFAFSSPPFNKAIYQLMYPHYERAINHNVELKSFYDDGILRHIVAFYFWGYEDLNSNGLLVKFLNQAKTSSIANLVNFIWRQEDYQKNLNEDEREKFLKIIFELWEFLAKKYEHPSDEEEQKVLANLSNFVVFISELNETNTALILKSIDYINEYYYKHELIESLIALKSIGIRQQTARHIGQLLSSLLIKNYLRDIDREQIIDLVTFLFENGQEEFASKFCNTPGHEFLKEVYNKFKT